MDHTAGLHNPKLLLWGVLLALLMYCHMPFVATQLTDPTEVSALRAVKRSLKDPMRNLMSWNKGDPCTSKWEGVVCNDRAENDGYLHVKKLHLLNLNLSGTLAPELGQLSHLKILDFMWNNISGSIPKEIGNISSLELLVLNGNHLSGPLPDELGQLSKLNRLQIDENDISGAIPKSFLNLSLVKHLHMNNNSISGQIPAELASLPELLHLLLDNNNLSGHLPQEFSKSPKLLIFQLDNNNFSGSSIPVSYRNMSNLIKLSLRNCSLQGTIPDFSEIPHLTYLDLSWNNLEGSLPCNKLSTNVTTILLSNNRLNGSIPSNFSGLPVLQKLYLNDNLLTGSVPSSLWENTIFGANSSLALDLQNNNLLNISGAFTPHQNITILLKGNPICASANQSNLSKACQANEILNEQGISPYSFGVCPPQSCPEDQNFEYVLGAPVQCVCAAPVRVGYRLKSPGLSQFRPYLHSFEKEEAYHLNLSFYQLRVDSYVWEEGPRLRMYLKIFPNLTQTFNKDEILYIRDAFAGWEIHNSDIFGPYEFLNITLLGPYATLKLASSSSASKSAFVATLVGAVTGCIILSAVISIIIVMVHSKYRRRSSKKFSLSKSGIKAAGLKGFSFEEMSQATENFSDAAQVGRGGYGKVYKGILADGTVVAIKRAEEGSLQGSMEFCNEIEFLSRLHHRNLVSLVGYCDEDSEQMLIYEYMPNGTLHDHLSKKSKEPLNFCMRLHIALGSAKGIHYLHAEADPPILHRDIKASNILLDSKFTPKIADFGLSRLAPVPDDEGMLHGHVSTMVRGTPGYLDPEYFLTYKLTDKSDVYSLGVVFLGLLTGQPPVFHGKNIVHEVRMAYQAHRLFPVVDDRMGSYPAECVEKFAALALRCCHKDIDSRPSMREVVQELESLVLMTPFDAATKIVTGFDSFYPQTPHSGDQCTSTSFSNLDSSDSHGGITTIYPR